MIVIMKSEATKAQIKSVIERVKKEGLEVHLSEGEEQTIIGLVGDTRKMQDVAFNSYDGVENAVRISLTYKLTSREFHPRKYSSEC